MENNLIYIEIKKDYDDQRLYNVRFRIDPNFRYASHEDKNVALFKKLDIEDFYEYDKNPIRALLNLQDEIHTYIIKLGIGIGSCSLVDELDQLIDSKIEELKKIKPIYVKTKPSGSGYSAYTVVNDYEPYDITDEISALTTTIDSINGRGLSKKKALENYIHNLESYEAMVHTFITQVKELSKEELNENSH